MGENEQKWGKMNKHGQKNLFCAKYSDLLHKVEHLFLNFWSKLEICCIKWIFVAKRCVVSVLEHDKMCITG